jgi:hypothetical protein
MPSLSGVLDLAHVLEFMQPCIFYRPIVNDLSFFSSGVVMLTTAESVVRLSEALGGHTILNS